MASVGGGNDDVLSLNLTPMLDIFSILVTFLLMSYSTDPVSYDVNENVELPQSVTLVNMDETPSITVTKKEIFVNEKKVSDIINGDIPEADRSQGAAFTVFKELEKLAKMNKKVVAANGEETKKKAEKITMEMDKGHRFKLAKRIMLAGQQTDFVTFKLMVSKEEL